MTAGGSSGFDLSYGDLLAVAARVMGDETLDEQGRIVAPAPDTGEPRRRCERAVRRAMARLMGESQDWTFARNDVDLTFSATGASAQNVEGQAGDYWMPWWFRHEAQDCWQLTGSVTGVIDIVPDSKIEEMRQSAEPSQTGVPLAASFRTRNGRQVARFWPIPDAAYSARIRGKVWLEMARHDGDVFPIGVEALAALEAAVEYEAAKERGLSAEMKQEKFAEWQDALRRLREADGAKKPRQAGRLRPTMRHPLAGGLDPHPPANTVTFNGAAI